MPLNPPTYKGLDVYYSTNVFVNKVPVALWEPPAGAFNDGTPGAFTAGGDKMFANNGSGYGAMYKYQRESMGGQEKSDDPGGSDSSSAATSPPGSYVPKDGGTGPDPNPSAPAQPGDVELTIDNLPDTFPNKSDPIYNKRISKYFKLSTIQCTPVDEPAFNLKARDVAANWINLCCVILDPLYSQFKFQFTSAYRSTDYCRGKGMKPSDHTKGWAADITMPSKEANDAMVKWMLQNKLPVWQVIRECNPGKPVGWVHVAYNKGNTSGKGDARWGWTTNGNAGAYNWCGNDGARLPSYLKA